MSQIIGKSIIVKGKVQGVFYRASTLTEAQNRNLTGRVKNLSNGDVHIQVFGKPDEVDELIEWCKTGPDYSRVDEVTITDIEVGEVSSFLIEH